jgi:glutathione S-transferase
VGDRAARLGWLCDAGILSGRNRGMISASTGLEPQRDWSFTMIKRFTLYGSPHSLPTYKVALMLRLSGEPFSFRYVSFQKGMHKTPEFLALSRWGQVPVLVDNERVHLQSAAIVEHLAETLNQFQGSDSATRQAVREWLYWDVDVLFPPIFNCYGVHLGQRKLLPISVEPTIADYHRRRAEAALSVLDLQLTDRDYLCAAEPTIADLFCYGDVAFAEICAFALHRWTNVVGWTERVTALPGFKAPFALLTMQNAELS